NRARGFTASRVFGFIVLAFAVAPSVALAQAPTGYASIFLDRLPHRDTTELRTRVFAQEKVDVSEKVRVVASGFAEGLVADRGGPTDDGDRGAARPPTGVH